MNEKIKDKKRPAKRSKKIKVSKEKVIQSEVKSTGLEITNPERLTLIAMALKEFSKNFSCGALVLGNVSNGKVHLGELVIPPDQQMWEDFFEIDPIDMSAILKKLKEEKKLQNVRAIINFVGNCKSLLPCDDLLDTIKAYRCISELRDLFVIILDCEGNFQVISNKAKAESKQLSLDLEEPKRSSSAWKYCPRHPSFKSVLRLDCPECFTLLVDEEELKETTSEDEFNLATGKFKTRAEMNAFYEKLFVEQGLSPNEEL